MKITNRMNLPQPIVDAVANDDYTRGQADISVTSLISPPRLVALREAHSDAITEDASDLIFALIGKSIHKILETAKSANMLAIPEQRLYMKVGEYVVSGALDRMALIDPDGNGRLLIQDYKTASVNEMIYGVKVEREQQLNIYKILAEVNGYEVEALEAVFILRDWSKVKEYDSRRPGALTGAPQQSAYPESQVVRHPVRIWDRAEAYAFIAERVRLHMETQQAYAQALRATADPQIALPECDDEERWARPEGFAVTKEGNKVATRVFVGDAAEAAALAFVEAAAAEVAASAANWRAGHPASKKQFPVPVYSIEERTGRSVRCMFYCLVSSLCEQWKEIERG